LTKNINKLQFVFLYQTGHFVNISNQGPYVGYTEMLVEQAQYKKAYL